MKENWTVICKKADFRGIGAKFGIDPVTARVIRNRGLTEEEEIRQYLCGNLDDLHDPHLLKDADLLVELLSGKIKEGKRIRIIGDYDIDGVMSTYILKKALLRCGADVSAVIPDRIIDGYGLNENLICRAAQDGVDTILTCDNGIAALKEIAMAKECGMTVLVTDHHAIPFHEENGEKVEEVSQADAVVNPHQKACGYPFEDLCGAAVAWKVVCLLYERMDIPYEEALDFLENVAFATVGDIMPLQGENRILVKEGLKRIHRTKNPGLRALIRQCGVEQEQVAAYHFGFVLGPCINATGRLDTAYRALELLFSEDERQAALIAAELRTLNEERKEMTAKGVEEACRIAGEPQYEKDTVLVIFLPTVHESIAGIIAGRIRELYHKPTYILTRGAAGAKGSGRSIEAYSMYEELCRAKDLLDKFGGHPMAAGLSLPEENIGALRSLLNRESPLTEADLIPKVRIDVPMPMAYVTMDLIREFSLLEPFGKNNERPLFADRNLTVRELRLIGKNRDTLTMTLLTESGMAVRGILFKNGREVLRELEETYSQKTLDLALRGMGTGIVISAVYVPKINVFKNSESIQMEIRGIRCQKN